MTLAELKEKLSLMSRSSTCNVEPWEAAEMLAAVRKAVADEREACAQLADDQLLFRTACRIRARGER